MFMKKVLLLMLIMIPAVAFARFEKLTADIDEMFARFSGYVVSAENNSLITDLGRSKGVYNGMQLKIYRESEPIIHPVTKQVLGNKKIYVGDITITNVEDAYSDAKITSVTRTVKPGDIVTMNPPVEVAVKIDGLPPRLEMLLKEELGNVRNILVKENAGLALSFTQKDEGGIGYTVSDNKNGTTIYSKYFSDKDLGESGTGAMGTKDMFRSRTIDATYKSMAAGHVKPDGRIYIAAATMNTVDFFIFTGQSFEPAGSLGRRFDNIQNIELADLDGDGTDEIFITEVKYESTVRSSIFEFDGAEFKTIDENMQFIFRTASVKGEKKIVTQQLSQDGSYIGMVSELVHLNGRYEKGRSLGKTGDVSIYGFGYSDINDDGENEVFHIGQDYKLNVYNGTALKYSTVEEFGQTPYHFVLKSDTITQQEYANPDQKDVDPFAYELIKKYIKGRVFVNSDGNIYVVKNDKKYKILSNSQVYESSRFAVFSWDGRRLGSVWQSDVFEPLIVDYFMYEEFGRTYMFLLRNFSDSLLSATKSQFIYIETK
jgi:hypothetical protein